MPRQARLDAPGLLQHRIARGIQKTRILSNELDYRFFLKRYQTREKPWVVRERLTGCHKATEARGKERSQDNL